MKHTNGPNCERCNAMLPGGHPVLQKWGHWLRERRHDAHFFTVWRGKEDQDRAILEKKSFKKWPLSEHNEPLQILFEGGAWRLTLAIVFVWRVLVGAGDRPWLLSTCFALLTLSTTQFPLRFFFSALFCLLVARVSLDNHALEEPWRKS